MSNRRWWIAGGVVLLLAVGLLWWGDQGDDPPVKSAKVDFPTHLRPDEEQRVERRRTPVVHAVEPQVTKPAAPVARRDSLIAALPDPGGKPAFVIEVNALRNSRLGEKLIACMGAADKKGLDNIREQMGIDPLRDIDRVAFVGDTAYMSGALGGLKLPDIALQPSGADGQVGQVTGHPDQTFGLWNGQLAMIGQPSEVSAALSRVQGQSPAGGGWLPEASEYGDIYGVLPPEVLARLLPADQQGFAQQFAKVAQQISFHVDAQDDVAMTFDIGGSDASGLSDLSKTVSAAISVARLSLSRDKDPELVDLLDQAKVEPSSNGGFTVEMVLPQATILKALGNCSGRDGGD